MMVLLIDDKKEVTSLLHKKLLECGIESDTASNFYECQRLFDSGKRYRAVVADYNLHNGATGLSILQMYSGIDPEAYTILYSASDIDNTLPLSRIDRVISKINGSLNEITNILMSICSEKLQPRVLAKMFGLIQTIDQKIESVIKVEIPSIRSRDKQIDDFMFTVNKFMDRGRHDLLWLIGALGLFIGVATAIIKLIPVH